MWALPPFYVLQQPQFQVGGWTRLPNHGRCLTFKTPLVAPQAWGLRRPSPPFFLYIDVIRALSSAWRQPRGGGRGSESVLGAAHLGVEREREDET